MSLDANSTTPLPIDLLPASIPPAVLLPKEPRVSVVLEVFYFDTDAAGVVHNIAYLRMVEVARTALAKALGWTLAQMEETGLVPFVHRTEIDYLKPARLGDTVLILAELSVLEKVRFHIAFKLVSEKNPKLIFARCRQVMVTVHVPTGRPQRVLKQWRQAYPGLCAAD